MLGRFKLTPPYAAMPYREIVGGDGYWRALFALGHGPIAIEEISHRRDRCSATSGTSRPSSAAATGRCRTAARGTLDRHVPGDIRRSAIPGPAPRRERRRRYLRRRRDDHLQRPRSGPSAAAWDRDQGKPFTLYPRRRLRGRARTSPSSTATPELRTSQAERRRAGDRAGVRARPRAHREPAAPASGPTPPSTSASSSRRPARTPGRRCASRTITGRQTTPLYWGWRWKTSRLRRRRRQPAVRRSHHPAERRSSTRSATSATSPGSRCARSPTGDPAPVPAVALLAVRITSSGQLSGALDEFNVIARTIARD